MPVLVIPSVRPTEARFTASPVHSACFVFRSSSRIHPTNPSDPLIMPP